MKIIATALILIGTIIGPGISFYKEATQSKKIGELPVIQSNTFVAGTAGMSSSISLNKSTQLAHQIYLSPEMNPIKFTYSGQYTKGKRVTTDTHTGFEIDLSLDNQPIWHYYARFTQPKHNPKKTSSNTLVKKSISGGSNRFEVTQAGNYLVKVTKPNRLPFVLHRMNIQVKGNVPKLDTVQFGGGLAIMMLGIVMVVFTSKKQS